MGILNDIKKLFEKDPKHHVSEKKEETVKKVLSKELEFVKEELKKHEKSLIKIKLADTENVSVFQSKFSGNPYFPKDKIKDYPKSKDGKPLNLLAQFNLEELPENEYLPKKGMLQFYIANYDDVYGLDFDDPLSQKDSRVIYFPEVVKDEEKLVTDFSFIPKPEEDYSPINRECSIEFEAKKEVPTKLDYHFDEIISDEFLLKNGIEEKDLKKVQDDIFDHYFSEDNDSSGHKLFGYPHFTQNDPRSKDRFYDYVLLFQMDTDYNKEKGIDIMWGDAGVANFFITQEDLKKMDFSRVLYNWDCC